MPVIAAKVDDATKSGFADLARQNGLSESDLIRRMVDQLLGNNPTAMPAPIESRRGGRQVKLRLWRDELEAVERLAGAEARSVPAWIAALVRRSAMGVIPFNPAEIEGLRQAIAALGPLGRNLNTVVRYWHQTGRVDPDAIAVGNLSKAVAAVRQEVGQLADRASNRYTPSEPPVVETAGQGAK